jgi:hypothetical protein
MQGETKPKIARADGQFRVIPDEFRQFPKAKEGENTNPQKRFSVLREA